MKETENTQGQSSAIPSTDGLGVDFERELRAIINPAYADTRGTESYERKRLLGEIDRLRDGYKRLELMLQMAYCQKIGTDTPHGLECCDNYRDWLQALTPNVLVEGLDAAGGQSQ